MSKRNIPPALGIFGTAILIIICVLALVSFAPSNYCEGFKSGYKDGYCYKKVGCISPIPPICPVPKINEENTYKGGYQRGFRLGLKHQK